MSHSKRRAFLKATGAIGIAGISGCIESLTGGGGGTVKIGAPVPLSGPLDLLGQETRKGHKFAKQHIENQVLGEDVEIVVEDTETNPSVGLQKVKKLVENEQVDALTGVSSSAVGLGIAPYLKNEAEVPFVISQVWTTDARENSKYCNKNWFFTWASARQAAMADARYINKHIHKHTDRDVDNTKAHFLGLDYAAGQSARDNFQREFENLGGSMTGQTMVPQDEKDFSIYMEDLKNADADVITAFLPGPAGVQFTKQSDEFGLKEEKEIVSMADTGSPVVTSAAGKAANGVHVIHWYAAQKQNQLNNKFTKWYRNNNEKLPPNGLAANGFNALYSLTQAMEESGSRQSEDVIGQLEGYTYDSPMGELTYRASDHQTKLNFVAIKVEKGKRNVKEEYPKLIGPAKCNL